MKQHAAVISGGRITQNRIGCCRRKLTSKQLIAFAHFLCLIRHRKWREIRFLQRENRTRNQLPISLQQRFENRFILENQNHKHWIHPIDLLFRKLLGLRLPTTLKKELADLFDSISNQRNRKCEQASVREVHLIIVNRQLPKWIDRMVQCSACFGLVFLSEDLAAFAIASQE